MLKDFSRSSSSASSFASVVEETEGVDGDDTGLVRGPRVGVLCNRLGWGLFGAWSRFGWKPEPGCVSHVIRGPSPEE